MVDKILIYFGMFLIVVYLFTPVPYCSNLKDERVSYDLEEVGEIKGLDLMFLKIKGTSMFPTLKDKEICLCVQKEVYSEKDIVFFPTEINGKKVGVVHRIIFLENEIVITKGDNNNWTDPSMSKENIICAVPIIPKYLTLKWF